MYQQFIIQESPKSAVLQYCKQEYTKAGEKVQERDEKNKFLVCHVKLGKWRDREASWKKTLSKLN